MKLLQKIYELWYDLVRWLKLHAVVLVFGSVIWLAIAYIAFGYGFQRGREEGFAAAGEPVTEYVDRFTEHDYIANVNSEIFHRSSCMTLPYPDKRVYFDDREVAVGLGYRPCKNCSP